MIATCLHSPAETGGLARLVARFLEPGAVLALEGDIGSGKTTFVRELAVALAALEPARSPTFTVAHRYELAGERTLAHLDLYRQGQMRDSDWYDLEPYFESTFVAVEWPQAGGEWLASRTTWRLRLEHAVDERRIAYLDAPAAVARELADGFIELTARARVEPIEGAAC